jgi:HTH-type transcriptional regulator / antitoxin HigA
MNMTASAERYNAIQDTIKHWKFIAPVIHEPQNMDDYEKLARFLDILLNIVGENESHELIGLVDVVSHMLAMYDEAHVDFSFENRGVDALKFLMKQHGLKQTDLKAELGSQGVVSEILNGSRQLNLNQIKKLAVRFKLSVDTFID